MRSVWMPCARAMFWFAPVARREAPSSEPIQDRDRCDSKQAHHKDRVAGERSCALGHILHKTQGDQQFIQIFGIGDIDRNIGFHPHDGQIDRPQAELCQDPCQNRGNSTDRVQETGCYAGCHSRQQRGKKRQPDICTRAEQYHEDSAPGTERPIHRQVRNIQNLIGNIYANRHDSPDQSLRYGPWQRTNKRDHRNLLLHMIDAAFRQTRVIHNSGKGEPLFRHGSAAFAG